jgi:hypothetical protein
MNELFPLELFTGVFEKYNLAIWPMQVVAYILGIVSLFLVIKRTKYSNRINAAILSFLWLWIGIVFFLLYFAPIFSPHYVFGGLFIIQGILFLASVIKPRISFGCKRDVYSVVGILFIAYAMIGYPAVGYLLCHRQSAPFGVFPCPTTVFTFGLLLLVDKKVPKLFLVIPPLWALMGGFPPVFVGIFEDIGLIVAGLLGTAMILYRDTKRQD